MCWPNVPIGTAVALATWLALLSLTPGLAAQDQPVVGSSVEGVTLNFQGTDLPLVITMLADLAGLTVTYSGLPSRPVTLRSAQPVPRTQLREILESVIQANGLTMIEEGGLVRIAATEGGQNALPFPGVEPPQSVLHTGPQLYTYRLKHTQAEPLAQTLRELFGLRGRDSAFPDAGGPSQPRGLTEQRLALPLGPPVQQSDPGVSPPVAAAASQLQGQVQIVPYSLNNSIMIRASPADYEAIRAAIDQLDTRPLQVLIEALILEVRRDRQFDLGIDISVPDQKDLESGITLGGELAGNSAGDVVLRVLNLGGVGADVVVRALAAKADINVLSRPLVLAQNNQEARILVGAQRPFIQLFRSLPTDAAVRDQVVQYRDVGTQLTITPTINPDGYVTLDVLQEISNATAETQFGAPVISTREAETQLFIKDGHTAIIGGLIDRQLETGDSGIPFLKDIPLLGHLFRSTHRRNTTTELFILLTPHVVRIDEELDDIQRQLIDKTRVLRSNREDLAPLIEMDSTGAGPEQP